MSAKPKTYEGLKSELDAIMAELQQDDIAVDRALTCYRRGLELAKQIEDYLRTAENTVKELKSDFKDAKA